ncbi:unnamed protein product [Staurois parvus]|uniref:Uncharacterized protein n=1 Tax=Staurois parvus TaxID=386267 RepID=A0ABN9FRK3_9NEOB|nr:unnamed protein product [Staurois parvus]
MCRMAMVQSVLSGGKMWTFEQEEEQRRQDQTSFLHNAEDNPLDSTVSITSMHYCQGRTDHLETRALPEGPGSVGAP